MSAAPSFDPIARTATETALPRAGVAAVLRLLDEGATVPFIARYRKEATGSLDEVQIRLISETRERITDLEKRRSTIISTISEQGKLTDELKRRLLECADRATLEDLYLPFKPKRRTRAAMARERGLELLANRILAQPRGASPSTEARRFVDPEKEVPDVEAALGGARDIVAEVTTEDVEVRAFCRQEFMERGVVTSTRSRKAPDTSKFELYYEFSEPVRTIPSHRFLAIARGEAEGMLSVRVEVDDERLVGRILRHFEHDERSAFGEHLALAVRDGLRRLLGPSLTNEVRALLKERSDIAAIEVFASNLEALLLAPALGTRSVVGIDPGLRTGCKCAAVTKTGRYEATITVFPSRGGPAAKAAAEELVRFCKTHRPYAVAVGNGTGGRETHQFARRALRDAGLGDVLVVEVNEAGASVYSASDVARKEFPQLDLTVRGAISIARRLQDPLAELVKIDPKSIGVGQYQHDVSQPLLARKLTEVVETCVNRVGVELNTASASLLSFVAGIGPTTATRIVERRDTAGPFHSRTELLQVSGVGPKTFEQAAGFLRIRGGAHPLDASAVHPERYALVEQMARDLGVALTALVGNARKAGEIPIGRYVSSDVGEPTLRDIVSELQKPGRDPRQTFEAPSYRDDVNALEDLKPGMWLEGTVTNVTHFGAFVDVGVHQDGLVHISQLADRFVKDPREAVSAGQRIKVRVLEVDLDRRRISLSAKREQRAGDSAPPRERGPRPRSGGPEHGHKPPSPPADKGPLTFNPFEELLKKRKR